MKGGRGRATKQDGHLERELRAATILEGRRGREDSRTTHLHNSGDAEPCPGAPQQWIVRQKTHDSPQADKARQEGRSRVLGRPRSARP
ncbi:hypothetical protein NDU88_004193 [Pleurodeles waltl]|uniref:Uncharacterized protein n=1 Tax=Pleurodeles waltl TaxID=8319 RepID=A0AAV7MVS2_PLEWA|nr:hypothetical protein NDU88_004193 [Pleurodeles waltl]